MMYIDYIEPLLKEKKKNTNAYMEQLAIVSTRLPKSWY